MPSSQSASKQNQSMCRQNQRRCRQNRTSPVKISTDAVRAETLQPESEQMLTGQKHFSQNQNRCRQNRNTSVRIRTDADKAECLKLTVTLKPQDSIRLVRNRLYKPDSGSKKILAFKRAPHIYPMRSPQNTPEQSGCLLYQLNIFFLMPTRNLSIKQGCLSPKSYLPLKPSFGLPESLPFFRFLRQSLSSFPDFLNSSASSSICSEKYTASLSEKPASFKKMHMTVVS